MRKKLIVLVIVICFGILVYFLLTKPFFQKNKDSKQNSNIANYKTPPVPEGFSKVETENASWKENNGIVDGWNNGLVIEDSEGNQFVWVPCSVEDNSEVVLYSRYWDYGRVNNTIPVKEDKIYHGSTESNIYYFEDDSINEDIRNSVVKYGGFYIGRYEAGKNNDKVCIKSDVDAYVNVTQDDAIRLSKELEKSKGVRSYLMTSYCYDTTIKWMSQSDNNFYNDMAKRYEYMENEISIDQISQKTGGKTEFDINNINNLFGNIIEWTTEKYNNNDKEIRGVCRRNAGRKGLPDDAKNYMDFMDYTINVRSAMPPQSYSDNVHGFRIILVIDDI